MDEPDSYANSRIFRYAAGNRDTRVMLSGKLCAPAGAPRCWKLMEVFFSRAIFSVYYLAPTFRERSFGYRKFRERNWSAGFSLMLDSMVERCLNYILSRWLHIGVGLYKRDWGEIMMTRRTKAILNSEYLP